MNYCAKCKKTVPDEMPTCQNDGSLLIHREAEKNVQTAINQVQTLFSINIDVAIKIINPRLGMSSKVVERFLREARAAALIDHPNAVTVSDFGRSGKLLYLVMEYIQGYSLANLISKENYLTANTTAEIMTQVCSALDAAHSHNIIHRDLKPDNIMIKRNDT